MAEFNGTTVMGVGDLPSLVADAAARLRVDRGRAEAIWFRGQSGRARPLLPKMFRWRKVWGPEPSAADVDGLFRARESEFRTHESAICAHFMLRAPSRRAGCPSPSDRSSWLLLMQDYGLESRLLDWTESALVAAYFAAEGAGKDPDQPAEIVALNPGALAEEFALGRSLCNPTGKDATRLADAAFDRGQPYSREIQPWLTHEIDARITVQRGCFTCHDGAIAIPDTVRGRPVSARYEISPSARARLRDDLRAIGITRAYLFPDLAELAAAITSIQL